MRLLRSPFKFVTRAVKDENSLSKMDHELTKYCVILAACLLTSCIDCREEIWFNSAGGGRADITYSLPAITAQFQGGESGVRQRIEKFLADTKGIQFSTCAVATENERLKIHVTGSFKSAQDFKKITAQNTVDQLPPTATNLAGKFEVRSHGREINYSRIISPGTAIPGAGFMPASTFASHHLIYIIHFPVVPADSNATRTEDDGRTLVWDFPLETAILKPENMRFKVIIPYPAWVYLISAGVVLATSGLLFFGLKRLKNRACSVNSGCWLDRAERRAQG
jgi:hypothetical protein